MPEMPVWVIIIPKLVLLQALNEGWTIAMDTKNPISRLMLRCGVLLFKQAPLAVDLSIIVLLMCLSTRKDKK